MVFCVVVVVAGAGGAGAASPAAVSNSIISDGDIAGGNTCARRRPAHPASRRRDPSLSNMAGLMRPSNAY